MTGSFRLLAAVALALSAAAQVTPAPPPQAATPAVGLHPLLVQLEQAADATRLDLARLRIEKWKADSNLRQQSQANAESLERNISQALPTLIAAVRSAPGSTAAAFKLYRNLGALYDVLARLTESAGASGSREEYQALHADTRNLDAVRRTLADQLEQMTAGKDAELTRLQQQIRQAAAAASAAPPKKIVVDDAEAAKKPARKKKPAVAAQPPQ